MADHFTYRVSWSEEDGEYVGTCLEFPSLLHLAEDPLVGGDEGFELALASLDELVEELKKLRDQLGLRLYLGLRLGFDSFAAHDVTDGHVKCARKTRPIRRRR